MAADHRDEFEAQLSAYLDGELSERQRAEVEGRLASDLQARRLLDELKATIKAVQGLPRATASDELLESLRTRMERRALLGEGGAAERPPARRSGPALRWLATAAVIGLAFVATYLMWPFDPDAQDRSSERQYAYVDKKPEVRAPAPAARLLEVQPQEGMMESSEHVDGDGRGALAEGGRRRDELAPGSPVTLDADGAEPDRALSPPDRFRGLAADGYGALRVENEAKRSESIPLRGFEGDHSARAASPALGGRAPDEQPVEESAPAGAVASRHGGSGPMKDDRPDPVYGVGLDADLAGIVGRRPLSNDEHPGDVRIELAFADTASRSRAARWIQAELGFEPVVPEGEDSTPAEPVQLLMAVPDVQTANGVLLELARAPADSDGFRVMESDTNRFFGGMLKNKAEEGMPAGKPGDRVRLRSAQDALGFSSAPGDEPATPLDDTELGRYARTPVVGEGRAVEMGVKLEEGVAARDLVGSASAGTVRAESPASAAAPPRAGGFTRGGVVLEHSTEKGRGTLPSRPAAAPAEPRTSGAVRPNQPVGELAGPITEPAPARHRGRSLESVPEPATDHRGARGTLPSSQTTAPAAAALDVFSATRPPSSQPVAAVGISSRPATSQPVVVRISLVVMPPPPATTVSPPVTTQPVPD